MNDAEVDGGAGANWVFGKVSSEVRVKLNFEAGFVGARLAIHDGDKVVGTRRAHA